MQFSDFDRFNELAESCGNRYLAVRWISEWSRYLGQSNIDYHVLESKLIEWVITGKKPYSNSEWSARRSPNDLDRLEEFLSWVIDEDVIDEVKYLYKQSVKHHHVLTCKREDFSEGKKSRVNVLLRMIWFSTSAKGEFYNG